MTAEGRGGRPLVTGNVDGLERLRKNTVTFLTRSKRT
jgi:hypothetical protein